MQKKDAVNKKGDNKHNICTIKFENVCMKYKQNSEVCKREKDKYDY